MEIIDAHQHVGGMAGMDGLDAHGAALQDEIKRRTADMDDIGIAWAIIQPTQMYMRPLGVQDTRRTNDEVASLARLAPERFRIALGTVDPLHGKEALREMERCMRELGLHGISWHHRFQGTYIDSPLMMPALEKLRELGGFPLIHTNATSKLEAVWRLARMARRFPELTFLALDAFHTYEEGEHALFCAETEKNILWDLGGPVAAWPIGWEMIERWIKQNGAERLTYSADYIGQGTHGNGRKKARSVLLERIVESGLSESDKALILGGNVRRELGKYLR
jgi:predicted TIM-barrel fold metal-dependent hydrolase